MKYLFLILLSFNAVAKNTVSEKPFYGEKITAPKAIEVESVVAEFSKYKNKNLVMEAQVDKVCTSKGCWMILKGAKGDLRVKFKDYKFFVPLSLIGKTVWLDGEISRKEVSIADTRHYLEDAGASKAQIEAVTSSTFEYSFLARGVKVVKR